jgi:hypothetical protein
MSLNVGPAPSTIASGDPGLEDSEGRITDSHRQQLLSAFINCLIELLSFEPAPEQEKGNNNTVEAVSEKEKETGQQSSQNPRSGGSCQCWHRRVRAVVIEEVNAFGGDLRAYIQELHNALPVLQKTQAFGAERQPRMSRYSNWKRIVDTLRSSGPCIHDRIADQQVSLVAA